MIVSHDLTIVSMIVNASIVVKVVMAILLLASMLSWTYIFMKIFAIRRDDEVLVSARVTVACVTGESFKPVEIPEALRKKMEASL